MIDKLINGYSVLIENEINRLFPKSNTTYKTVSDAARYSLLIGGKRIRPIILLEFYKLCGGNDDSAVNFAVALEMIHTYSLIHDDLPCMDNDDFRRGKPSCHKVYGEDMALLAGDGLLTEAFYLAAKTKKIPPERTLKALSILSGFAGIDGMVGGQIIDLQSEGKDVGIDTIKEMYLLKTAALIKAAATIGCILAGGENEKVKAAEAYGEKLGLAFQVIDDILDFEGDAKLLGKPMGSDEKNNKTTFVSFYGIEKSKQIADKLTKSALDILSGFDGDTKNLTELTNFLLSRKY